MEDFTKYAQNKIKIAELEKECDELKVKIIPQVKQVGEMIKYAGGKFYMMTRKSYEFSKTVKDFEKEVKDKVTILKDQEIEAGTAKETVTESLVFSIEK